MAACKKSQITFDTTSLEKLVSDPGWILENQELFWSEYRAQALTRKWADHVKYEIQYQEWREKVQGWMELSDADRQDHPLQGIARRILGARDEFMEKAVPHDCAYLPDWVDLSVTVQFTAFIPPFAFAMEDLVIDLASKHWNGNPEHVLNLLVHEIFHVGYSHYRTVQSEKDLVEENLYRILDNIVNEGICTYIGYRALPIFPVEEERDYLLLEDPAQVQRLVVETNLVLANYGKLPPEELGKLSWDKGVIGRAYYVAGAEMCRVIDEKYGRQALIDVYSTGPLSIIKLYNSLVEEELRIQLPSIGIED